MAGRLLVPVACAMCSWNAADRLASNAYGSVVACSPWESVVYRDVDPPLRPTARLCCRKTATIVFAPSYYSSSKYVFSCGHRYYKLT